MIIRIQYSTSEGPHLVEITEEEIRQMQESGNLTLTQPTPNGEKTITIDGTEDELSNMADLLNNASR